MNTENTYWNSKGRFNNLLYTIKTLIPSSGCVNDPRDKNKKLEKLRIAINCYYDLYNNGLCNRATEFGRIFGFSSTKFRKIVDDYTDELYRQTELKMDDIVYNAYHEQLALENI